MTAKEQQLLKALDDARKVMVAVSSLLATYPRPSNDSSGRVLLDSIELAKAGAHTAAWEIQKAKEAR